MLGSLVGAIGGGLGGAALAGRYLPVIAKQAVKAAPAAKKKASDALFNVATRIDDAAAGLNKYGAGDPGAIGAMATDAQNALRGGANVVLNAATALEKAPTTGLIRGGTQLGVVGAGAGAATLGATMGQMIDPEMPGSSNTQGARMSMQTYPGMY